MSVKGGPNTVTSGLVLELDAGNIKSYQSGSTTWFDRSGYANNGTLINGPTFNTGSGGSIVFDGVDDYVNIPSNTNIPVANSQYSINVWFSATSFGAGGLVGWGAYNSSNAVTALRFNSNGFRHYWWGNDLDVALSMSTNTWYNVIAQYNGTTRQIFLNAQVVGQDTPAGHNVPYATNLTVGVTNTSEYLNARIGVAQIYNRALSADEVLQNYNAVKSRFGL
jgi:hypothetical protein